MVSYVAHVIMFYTVMYKSSIVYCITIKLCFLSFVFYNIFYIYLLAVDGQARQAAFFYLVDL
jgi:hypothetical protein